MSTNLESEIFCDENLWSLIPEPILLNILYYLKPREILNAGQTCKRWLKISKDDFLWRKIFKRDFKVEKNVGLKPGSESWFSEYKRLTYNIPMILTNTLEEHTHQVLHVNFSHNGKLFATCSKDGFVIIWDAHTAKVKYSHDMKQFSWKYTQYSQFNQSDTLILVSGVHFGNAPHSTSGEIAVFTVQDESHLRCRIVNRPYDIFGTWFSDQHLISGDLHWLAHLVSTSILWLNKANQEIDSENIPIMNALYKFYNSNASSIRAIMIANCPWLNDFDKIESGGTSSITPSLMTSSSSSSSSSSQQLNINNEKNVKCTGNPLSHTLGKRENNTIKSCNTSTQQDNDFPYQPLENLDYSSDDFHYSDDFRRTFDDDDDDDDDDDEDYRKKFNKFDEDIADDGDIDDDDDDDDDDDEDDDLDNLCPKYLIFSTGSKTYTPHMIGFKRIKNVNFPKILKPGPTLKERIALREREKEQQNNSPRVEPDWNNFDAVSERFDKIDKLIDLHGHIIGMCLSPDHRYLYVNSRPWPKDYIISNSLLPPPIAQEIDIHVIDLVTLKKVGNMLRAHKAYTPNTECFFIFLDVCDNYVTSGAEDMHAYIWDRFYGMCLAKFPHNDVVNCCAFNPHDNEMLVTTSDDYKIKIWRSVAKAKLHNVSNETQRAVEFRKK